MFRLNFKEFSDLKSQFVISSWGGIRSLPFAFTENGVAMLSSVLNSERAVLVNIQIMRTFTRIRKLMASHQEILKQLAEHNEHLASHDKQIVRIFDVIQSLIDLPVTLKRKTKRIGFVPPETK
jgi:arsenate reductase-like glutaredoxin family protein